MRPELVMEVGIDVARDADPGFAVIGADVPQAAPQNQQHTRPAAAPHTNKPPSSVITVDRLSVVLRRPGVPARIEQITGVLLIGCAVRLALQPACPIRSGDPPPPATFFVAPQWGLRPSGPA
ncbi:hypothetical protein [Streptomyces sp. NPDC056948]|uniref:hypothetical protein n=1 Tax=Streptomyces sp. NPDC056948 TaxID=3345975 RepID=UPI00364159B9